MAIDKLVDSSQLDNNLTLVANAIRTKGGTSASLSFPTDFVTAINAISGSSGYTRTVIVPEQTVTPVYHSDGNTDGYAAQLTNATEMFEQWSEYIVTFNGTEYYFTTVIMWSSNYLMGDMTYLWRGTSETVCPYPFCVIATSINDSYIYTASADSVTIKIEKIELTGSGGSASWENIYSNEVNVNWEDWSDNPNNNCYYVMIPWTESIDYGSVWRITWDGTPYECTATLAGSSSGTPYMLGNNTYNNLEGGNNEPFMLQRYDSNLAIVSLDYGTHTILIEKQVTSSSNATLITKTITANGTYSASDDSADGYSSVTVNVAPPVTWETMADQTCTITTYDGLRIVTINGYNEPLSANETYRITWGDDQYICNTIVDTAEFTQDGYLFGNTSIFGSQYEDTGEPFIFYRTSSSRMTGVTNDTTSSSVYVKIERQESGSSSGIIPTGTLNITTNGTHDVTNYASASVSVTPNLQSKSATPTTSSQTISPDSGYDGLSSVTVGAIPSQYIVPTGNKAITANGNNIDVAEYATVSVSVSGSSKNVQTAQSTTRATSSTYTNLISLTCSTAGKYDIYWDCFRSSTSGTSGSQLYINGTGQGTANTTFTNHVQTNHLTNITLAEDDVVAVYARSRGNNYYAYVGTLTIVQTA